MQTQKKTFAFKLANKTESKKWMTRDGVAVAGCTYDRAGDARISASRAIDAGAYC